MHFLDKLTSKNNNQKKELSTKEKMELMIQYEEDQNIILKKIENIIALPVQPNIKIFNNVYNDLELFSDNDSIFNKINYTQTLFGKNQLKNWLFNVSSDIGYLKQKQQNLQYLLNYSDSDLSENFQNLIGFEKQIIWFWNDTNEDIQSLYNMVYYNIPFIHQFINQNELILNVTNIYKIFLSPCVTILAPVVSLLVPYLLLRFINIKIPFKLFFNLVFNNVSHMVGMLGRINSGIGQKAKYFSIFTTGLWIFLYLQSGYYMVQNSFDTNKIINLLHKKINVVANFVRKIINIQQICQSLNLENTCHNELQYFSNLFNHPVFEADPKLISNKGKILSVYQQFLENKSLLIPILKYIGEIDAYFSLSFLFHKHTDSNNPICFAKYLEKEKTPKILIKKLWHPTLDENPVTNDFDIGKKERNLLITGPNKAGKSTFIKSLALSIIFSQTIGITFAENYQITPFSIINTYLHIPDKTGYESLFEAEMYRAKDHISLLNQTNKNNFAFIIMDEIFTSTNYPEGYSAAYAIGKKLTTYRNSISVITTHYTDLSKLEKETKGRIKNYKFTIERDDEGKITYPYKIKKGISYQFIALELLRDNNFDSDILDVAIRIKQKFAPKVYD